MAKDKILKPFLGIIAPENKFTVDTIEDLKSRNYLTKGDVVEVLGYYTAGDGAHHKRKIESADDGSGVQLANGLWANIVHNGEVNVSWFGAKGDGITDDTAVLNKTLQYANNLFITTVKLGCQKKYLISKTITTFNSLTLDGCSSSFVFDKNAEATVMLELVRGKTSSVNTVGRTRLPANVNHIKSLTLDGYEGGFDGYIEKDSCEQHGSILCREKVVGVAIKVAGTGLTDVYAFRCYAGIDLSYSNVYLNTFFNCVVSHCYLGLKYAITDGITNSGENVRFIGGSIGNCVEAFYSFRGGLFFQNTSIDYNLFYTKNSTTVIGGGYQSAIVTFNSCWLECANDEYDNIQMNFSSSVVSFVACNIISKNKSKWWMKNEGDSSTTFESCTFLFTNADGHFATAVITDNSRATFSNCSTGIWKRSFVTKFSNNLIKNGMLETDDLSAITVMAKGKANIETIDGIRTLTVTPAPYIGQEYQIDFVVPSAFYLFFLTNESASVGVKSITLTFYDCSGLETGRLNGTLSGDYEFRKIVPPPGSAKVALFRQNYGTGAKIADTAIFAFSV